jgi:adenine-specific DNA-methyltransferase
VRSLFPHQQPQIAGSFNEHDRIVLHQGDVLDFLPSVPSSTVSLIVTSPPYNIGKEYEQAKALDDYLAEQDAVIEELARVLADDGSICWEVGNYVDKGEIVPLDVLFYPLFKKRNLALRNRIIWRFGHGLHASRRFSGRYETILWFTKTRKYTFNLDAVRVPSKYPGKTNYKPGPNYGKPSGNPLGKNPSDVWEVVRADWESLLWDIPNVKSNHPEKTTHPCQFPIELVQRCVLALTETDDWVLDPYSGVGSALLAGLLLDRRVIGCELMPEYVEETKRRIHALYAGELKVRPVGRPIHQPSGREKVSQLPVEWTARDGEDK